MFDRNCAWIALMFAANVSAAEPADLVVTSATVLTSDEKTPRAESFAVRDGRLVFIGANRDGAIWIGPKTTVLDLTGKTVMPGVTDAHAHPRPIYADDSRWATIEAGPERCRTMDELIGAIRKKAKITPKGHRITGFGYQETKLGRHPTKADLDKGSVDHPIIISHSSGHLSVCNSLALKLARVTKDTKDPPGGAFDRDENGEPTGLLKERAAGIVRGAVTNDATPPDDEMLEGYKSCFRMFVNRGITGVHVAGTSMRSARMMSLARGEMPIRLYVMLREGQIDEAVAAKKAMRADEAGVRFGAIKLFHGNSLSGQTCWLYEPYVHQPDYRGVPPARKQADLNALIAKIHDTGLQACVHSNGDREIDMVLDAYEAALSAKPRPDHRHRIEHCSVVNEKILARIKKLNLVIAPHSYVYEHGDKMENYGKARWDWMHPNRSLIDQGTVVAGNSDYPVSAAEPLLRIHDMVNRTSAEGKIYGAKQRCTAEQALRAFTYGGAYAEFAEDHKGTIAIGLLADFVVLSADPTKIEVGKLKDITVERTVIAGKVVYEKSSGKK